MCCVRIIFHTRHQSDVKSSELLLYLLLCKWNIVKQRPDCLVGIGQYYCQNDSGTCCLPVFCILQVFVNGVSGGTDSPSPIVTSSTNDMDGVLMLGLSKS